MGGEGRASERCLRQMRRFDSTYNRLGLIRFDTAPAQVFYLAFDVFSAGGFEAELKTELRTLVGACSGHHVA